MCRLWTTLESHISRGLTIFSKPKAMRIVNDQCHQTDVWRTWVMQEVHAKLFGWGMVTRHGRCGQSTGAQLRMMLAAQVRCRLAVVCFTRVIREVQARWPLSDVQRPEFMCLFNAWAMCTCLDQCGSSRLVLPNLCHFLLVYDRRPQLMFPNLMYLDHDLSRPPDEHRT